MRQKTPVTQKIYKGYRDGYRSSEPVILFVQDADVTRRPLPGVFPPGTWDRGAGFEWGYEGAGPKNLAAAILADYLGRAPHYWLVERFARQVIARLDVSSPWAIQGREIDDWLRQRRRAKSFVLFEEGSAG